MYVNFYLLWMKWNLSFSLCHVKILKLVYINKVLPSAVKSIFLSYATCNQFSNFKSGYATNTHAHTAHVQYKMSLYREYFFFVGVFLHIEAVAKYCHMWSLHPLCFLCNPWLIVCMGIWKCQPPASKLESHWMQMEIMSYNISKFSSNIFFQLLLRK